MSDNSPSAENPEGLSGTALENYQRERRLRTLNEKKAAEAAAAAAASSAGHAAAISADGGDAHDGERQTSEAARRENQLRADIKEAAEDLDAVELAYDNFLNECRKNVDTRSLTDIAFNRRTAKNDDLHREASDALQAFCEVSFEISGDQAEVDEDATEHRTKLEDLWHAVDATLRDHKATGRPRYEHPADRRSPSAGSRDSGRGAFQRGEGWTDGGPPRSAPAATYGGDNGVRFSNPRVRQGPLAQSYGASPRDEPQERERRDFESSRHEYNKYETPDERNRRQREQRDADVRAREEDSARSQRALSRTPARVGAYPGVAPPAPDEAYHEDYAVFANNTNNVGDTPTPEVSKRLLSALQFLQRAQPKVKSDKSDAAYPVGYSGRGQSLTDFHRQLTDSCSSAALPYDQYWHVFRHVLHASARSFYDGLPPDERRSYQTTFVRLRAYFEPHVMQMDTLSEYWNCKQGKSQSVEFVR